MSLRDAMALYWKAKSARVIANFSWTGVLNFGPPFPQGIVVTSFSLNADTELNFYNQSNKQNEPRERVCFNEQENEPLIAAELPVDGGGFMEFYLTFFFDKIPYRSPTTNASRVFVINSDQQPKNPEDEVYVNMLFSCVQIRPNLYQGIRIFNKPFQPVALQADSIINLIINGREYLIKTRTFTLGIQQFQPPSGDFTIIINTIEDFA
jgi:hypothetical protein